MCIIQVATLRKNKILSVCTTWLYLPRIQYTLGKQEDRITKPSGIFIYSCKLKISVWCIQLQVVKPLEENIGFQRSYGLFIILSVKLAKTSATSRCCDVKVRQLPWFTFLIR